MSETEMLRGKLKEFPKLQDEQFKSYIERFFKEKKRDVDPYYLNKQLADIELKEMFYNTFHYQDGVIVDEIIYEIIKIETFEYEDFYKAEQQKDKTIDFELKFYNGGCTFQEAMKFAFEKMKIQKQSNCSGNCKCKK